MKNKLTLMPGPKNPLIEVEHFSLYEWDDLNFWLQSDGGEGMTVLKSEVMKFFTEQWKEF